MMTDRRSKQFMLIRCTWRLMDELGTRRTEVIPYEGEIHPLDEWYAHVFFISRRKCVMFMNAKTRFSFVEMDLTRERLKSLDAIFRKGLSKALYEEDYPAETIKMFDDRARTIQLALTIDRSVIGTMNQFIKDFKYMYEYTRDDRVRDESELGRSLRRTPVLKHGFPDKNMKELLSSCSVSSILRP